MVRARLTTRQKESRKINRQRAMRKWWQATSRRLVFGSLTVVALFLAAGGWWFWHSGRLSQVAARVDDGFWQQTARLGFRVQDVYLEGRHFASLADINNALHVHPGDPIFALSLSDMRARLQAVPRVRYAQVERVLPDALHVHIVEREPVAVWQNNGKLHLIDQDGVVMEYVDPAQYPQLLLVVGEDAPQNTHALLGLLATEPDTTKGLTAAVRVGGRRWDLCFRNGLVLKLPEDKTENAWHEFAHLAAQNHLMNRAIATVDMRLSDRVFIRLKPQDMKAPKNAGSET